MDDATVRRLAPQQELMRAERRSATGADSSFKKNTRKVEDLHNSREIPSDVAVAIGRRPDAIGESSCHPITRHPISRTLLTICAVRQFERACMRACWDLVMPRLDDCSPSPMTSKPERKLQSAYLSSPPFCSPELH
jgi:hypothetical protein